MHHRQQITLRRPQLKDAKRFLEILSCPDFIYFTDPPGTLAEEKDFIRRCWQKNRDNLEHSFTILLDKKVIGAIGIKMNQHYAHIGEAGYFVDRGHWGQGIAPQALQLLESIAFGKLALSRVELVILVGNQASVRVAEKSGYSLEGIQRGKLIHDGGSQDAYLFAKIKKDQNP